MQPEPENLNPALQELEAALAGLIPVEHRIDRDRLMFEAGRRSAGRNLYGWRVAAAVFAAGLGLSLAVRSTNLPAPSVVQQTPDVPAVVVTGSDASYFQVRRRVLNQGLDALPERRAATGQSTPSLRTAERSAQEI